MIKIYISTIIEIFFRQIPPARSTTHNIYPTDLTAQIISMITIIHTLNLASITHHTNSPRVRLRRPPRARPQLTRPPLLGRHCPPRCCAVRRARRSCASSLARPSSQRAARPSSAIHRSARLPPRARRPTRARPQLTRPPPGAPPATSATPDASAAPSPAAHLAAAIRPDAAPVRSPARPCSALPDHRSPPAARRA